MPITLTLTPELEKDEILVTEYLQTVLNHADLNSLRILKDLSKKKNINKSLKDNEFKIKLALH